MQFDDDEDEDDADDSDDDSDDCVAHDPTHGTYPQTES